MTTHPTEVLPVWKEQGEGLDMEVNKPFDREKYKDMLELVKYLRDLISNKPGNITVVYIGVETGEVAPVLLHSTLPERLHLID